MVRNEHSDKQAVRGRQAHSEKSEEGARILIALYSIDKDVAWLSKESGIALSTLYDTIRRGFGKPAHAVAVSKALRCSLDWLLTGEAIDPAGNDTRRTNPIIDDPDLVDIASINFAYGFGGAYLDAGDASIDRVKFSQAWLRERGIIAPPELIGVAQGIGDSMEPMFSDRDMIFFDRSARLEDHMGDKVWVFAYGQVGMVKILRPLPDGTIKIISANRMYPEEIAQAEELFIIGRVVSSWRNH